MLWTAIVINGVLKPTEGPGEVCDAKSVVTKTTKIHRNVALIIAHLLSNMKLPTHQNEIIVSKQIFQLLQNHLIVAQKRVRTLAKAAAPGPT